MYRKVAEVFIDNAEKAANMYFNIKLQIHKLRYLTRIRR